MHERSGKCENLVAIVIIIIISQEELRLFLSRVDTFSIVTCHTLILRAFLAALPWILCSMAVSWPPGPHWYTLGISSGSAYLPKIWPMHCSHLTAVQICLGRYFLTSSGLT